MILRLRELDVHCHDETPDKGEFNRQKLGRKERIGPVKHEDRLVYRCKCIRLFYSLHCVINSISITLFKIKNIVLLPKP